MTDKKLRISHVIVQTVVVYDDGEELTPGPQLQPVSMPLSQVAEFAVHIKDQVSALAEQIKAESDVAQSDHDRTVSPQ